MADPLCNSDKSKVAQEQPRQQAIVNTTIRQPNVFKRFGNALFDGGTTNIGGRIFQDVAVPFLKNFLMASLQTALFGGYNGYYPPMMGNNMRPNGYAVTNYNRISTVNTNDIRAQSVPQPYQPVYAESRKLSDVIFTFSQQAEEVLTSMQEILDIYGWVRVADFYDLCGQSCPNGSADFSYGWDNLADAQTKSCNLGYYIQFPKATQRRNVK